MSDKITTAVVLTKENHDRLKNIKEMTGIPMSRILEQGIEEKLDWEEKRLETIRGESNENRN